MELTFDDVKQGFIIVGLCAVGVIAALFQNWQLVTTIITGGFALLHGPKN